MINPGLQYDENFIYKGIGNYIQNNFQKLWHLDWCLLPAELCQQGIDKMQSLNSEQALCICSALKQTLWGSPWEEVKHQLKISASSGPVSIPAKVHPGTSFFHTGPITPHCLSFASKQLWQGAGFSPEFVFTCLFPWKPFQQRGQSRQRCW